VVFRDPWFCQFPQRLALWLQNLSVPDDPGAKEGAILNRAIMLSSEE
jgi:hypothetical protein